MARPDRQASSVNGNLIHFTLPASLLLFVFGLLIYIGAFFAIQNDLAQVVVTPEILAELQRYTGVTYEGLTEQEFQRIATVLTAQSTLTVFFVLTGLLIMLFAEPPWPWFAGGAPYRGNRLVGQAAIVLFVAFLIVLLVEPLSAFFQIVSLPLEFYLVIGLLTGLWLLPQGQSGVPTCFHAFWILKA